MKTLGLLGGMSWESTTTYYREINRRVHQVQGGLYSARCVVFSFDFAEIGELQHTGRWEDAGALLNDAAAKLRLAAAEAIVLCTSPWILCQTASRELRSTLYSTSSTPPPSAF
ncbi:hypothetical protein DL766_007812 [Monosporascus sp. MC13-8B]|uniref:Aspartate racemase n=1 Tax=Monosporascus cannonballus TaxID=155416 RepID=A0ABY0GYI0_9PEZI|nr:hypothetical protein DL762_007653 [Monosporascus cannonballus]RYO98562.1 hypothetical protein DL763_002092 [Monosporascus cannonballus]RYP21963.1 hypothetical protein DL766_007812 [Monosporascus sp. MC13-8B]